MYNRKSILKIFILLTILAIIVFIGGCGSESDSINYEAGGSQGDSVVASLSDNRKVYFTVYYSVNTKDLDKDLLSLSTIMKKYGGYAESTDIDKSDDRGSATYQIKIPTEKLDEFMKEFENGSSYKSKRINSTDITTSYVTTQSRIEALEASKAQYLDMLKNSNLTISEITTINDKIDDINTELNALNRQMTQYNNLIEYSTITIYFNQNVNVDGIGSVFDGYGAYLVGFLKVLLAIFLYTLPVAVIAGIILASILLPRYFKKKKANKIKENNIPNNQ